MANVIKYGTGQLTTLPSKVYVDSNILIASFFSDHRFYKKARNLLFLLIAAKVELYLSPISFNESWWAIICAEYEKKHKKKLRADWLKKNIGFVNQCKIILDPFRNYFDKKIQRGEVQIIDVTEQTINGAYDYMVRLPMMPSDSFHLSTMKCRGICAIATADRDFECIPDNNFQIITIR